MGNVWQNFKPQEAIENDIIENIEDSKNIIDESNNIDKIVDKEIKKKSNKQKVSKKISSTKKKNK